MEKEQKLDELIFRLQEQEDIKKVDQYREKPEILYLTNEMRGLVNDIAILSLEVSDQKRSQVLNFLQEIPKNLFVKN